MFNLSKYADLGALVDDAAESIGDSIETPEDVNVTQDEIAGATTEVGPDADEKARVLQLQQDQELLGILNDLRTTYPAEVEAINAFLSNDTAFRELQNSLTALPDMVEQYNMETMTPQVPSTAEYKEKADRVLYTVRRLNAIRREHQRNQIPLGVAAFNLRQHKQAQMPAMPMSQTPETGLQRFPIQNEGDFIAKFADDLLAFNNEPGTREYERARIAAEEIRSAVSPGFEEEANSIIESVMQLDETQRDTASDYLIRLYRVLLPPMLTGDQAGSQMEPVMSEKNQDAVEGIVRYSLTDSVLNNKGMEKTAADHFGQHYLLYGPTEKRICPKLRGKNLSVGDVVSEYTCRHHCLDGIVIDDNKTICGEALWRANAMDKYSREYVDENGDIVGGYINKRFEVNRNVPEENKMRLKPGETRKPRPASWGLTESRMQDMRAKEGQSREYRPETNTGNAFEWCHDCDQNNVEVSQAERNRREESMGHKSVQYTNRDQGENNPKKAFNLRSFKTAQSPVAYSPRDTHQQAVNPMSAGTPSPADIESKERTFDAGKPMSKMDNPIIDSSKPMSLQDMETVKYNFAEGEQKARQMRDDELLAAIQDLTRVIDVQESSSREGHPTPKLGYYHDERHTYAAELQRRKRQGTTAGFNMHAYKEAKGKKEKGVTYKGEHFDYNPWAVCNKSTGGKSKGEDKFERCVQHVKDQSRGKEMKAQAMSSADIKDRGVKDTHVNRLLDRKGIPGKPVGIPTAEKTSDSKKKT